MAEPTHRNLNGVRIPLTPEEIAEIKARWAAAEARPAVDPFKRFEDDPFFMALMQELAEAKGTSITTLKATLRQKWLQNGGV